MDPRVVILVPRREGFTDRDALWAFCRPWWEEQFPDWPIVEGHHDEGLFSRSAAVNIAAHLAGDWDVAVLIDSDVLTDPGRVREAIPRAIETGQMVVPFDIRYNLSGPGTQRILKGEKGSWKGFIARTFRDQHSSVVVIPRTLWDDIGGFDEAFRGWGMEDTAFALSCEVIAGRPLERLPGEVWHLNHASAPGEKHGSPSHVLNMKRLAHYQEAARLKDRHAIQALVAEGRGREPLNAQGIPRVLHRVVPEQTVAQAEAWWQKWQDLHPGWRFLTHRDPLDPAQWPLTSRHWGKVKAGAQLADLVRLEALYRWGGVYVDQDMEPYRSLEPLLGAEVFAAWEDERCIPNAVMGARPGHPLVRKMIGLAIQRMRKSVWEGGPGVTTEVLKMPREGVLVLPPATFYRVHYRDPDRDDAMVNLPPAPWEFARHHYWGSWLPPERRKVPQ
jgi:hypothetical protein